jgi:hypothetical protein
MHPFEALPDSLRSAFEEGHNQISFAIREKKYLFLAEYDADLPSARASTRFRGNQASRRKNESSSFVGMKGDPLSE